MVTRGPPPMRSHATLWTTPENAGHHSPSGANYTGGDFAETSTIRRPIAAANKQATQRTGSTGAAVRNRWRGRDAVAIVYQHHDHQSVTRVSGISICPTGCS